MRYRTLGRTGMTVSEVGFGTAPAGITNYLSSWDPMLDDNVTTFRGAVHSALDLGYTFFDTAPAYGDGRAEQMLGEALEGARSRIVLATKCDWRCGHEREIEGAVHGSLRRLRTDYIDIMQLHGTYNDRFSANDVERLTNGPVYAALSRLKQQGYIRAIGITCEDPNSLIHFVESELFDTIQVRYNLVYQEAFHHLLPQCAERNVGVLVMRPAGSGILTKYLLHTKSVPCGGLSPSELSLNYVLSDIRIHSAIVGMRSRSSVERNAELSESRDLRVDLNWLHERSSTMSPSPWIPPL